MGLSMTFFGWSLGGNAICSGMQLFYSPGSGLALQSLVPQLSVLAEVDEGTHESRKAAFEATCICATTNP